MKVIYRDFFGRRVVCQCEDWPALWQLVRHRLAINRMVGLADDLHTFLNPLEP